jgi:hypothetical protein
MGRGPVARGGSDGKVKKDIDTEFAAASVDPNALSEFVNKCEDIIAAENNSWVARWTKSQTR